MFKYQLIFLGTITPLTESLISLYYDKIDDLKLRQFPNKTVTATVTTK